MNKLSLLALIVALIALAISLARGPGEAGKKETAYEHVMRTRTLRCGYVIDPPHVVKDPNTGSMSGVIVDTMNEAGKLLNLKVEWTEEVGWGNSAEEVNSGRIDALCTDYWMEPKQSSRLSYSMPLYYSALAAFVRANDTRFDRDLRALDSDKVTISAADGDEGGYVAQTSFPKAKLLSLPNMTDPAMNLMNVATGKADVAFVDAIVGLRFGKANPGKVKRLEPNKPLLVFPVTVPLPHGDMALKTMIDAAFSQLLQSGFIDRALTHYDVPENIVFRAAQTYQPPK